MSENKDNNFSEMSMVGEPKIEEPKIEEPKIEEPKIEELKIEETKSEESKIEIPKLEMPKLEIPKVEMAKVEAPQVAQQNVAQAPVQPQGTPTLVQRQGMSTQVQPQGMSTPVQPQGMSTPVQPQGTSTPVQPQGTSTPVQPRIAPYAEYQFSSATPTKKQKVKKAKTPKQKSGIGRKFALCTALALVFGLVAGGVFQATNMLGRQYLGEVASKSVIESTESDLVIEATENDAIAETVAPVTANQEASGSGNVADVAAKVMPSVVAISNIAVQEVPSFFGAEAYENESSGSGIIVGQNDTELLIATNNHVVEGAITITVTFIDESSIEAQVKGTDADNDLAVVAVKIEDIEESTLAEIKAATIGDSRELVVGEQVVAIGNALGYGQSVTSGYVSALDREVEVDESYRARLIQTDAAINPGNSGGALLNMQGELIGINAVKFAANGVEGMGYAIPISTAEPILDDLMSRTTREKVESSRAAYLGVSCRSVTAETSEMYDMPVGVFVAEVTAGGAAERAGIQKGDIITEFDERNIKTYEELVDALTFYAAGETVEVVFSRAEAGEYSEQTVSIVLDERPVDLGSQ